MTHSGKIDIVLINPYVYAPKTRFPPLGLLGIASILDRDGYNVKFIDMQIQPMDDVRSVLADLREDGIVGFGGATEGRFIVFDVAALAKSMHPSCTVIYGGPHASFTADITLKKVPAIDIIVAQEGELTISELAACVLDKKGVLRQISGISYREQGDIAHNPRRQRIRDLDSLPRALSKFIDIADYDQEFFFGKGRAFHLVTSRGCYASCNFCAASLLWGSKITTYSPERICDDIESLFRCAPDARGIMFADSTFTYSKERVLNICDEIEKRKLKFIWSCDIRANSVDYDLLARMRDAGCYVVSFGFESASKRVLDVIQKDATVEDAINVMESVTKLGMRTIINVTYGHPTETFEEALYTINFVKKYMSDNVNMLDPQPMRIYPGTELEAYAMEHKLLPEGFDWCVKYDNDPGLNRSTPFVPILLQPQLGIEQFKCLEQEFKKISDVGSNVVLPNKKGGL